MGQRIARYEERALFLQVAAKEYRFRWHPAPRAEALDDLGRWRDAWPAVPLFSRGNCEPEAIGAFRRALPAGLAEAVERFPSHQWNLLSLLGTESYARDLARTCPILAYCVANNHLLRGGTSEAAAPVARRHCRQPRREIVGWLGFPPTDSTARLMTRIPPEAVSPVALRGLQCALREQPQLTKLLLHLPTLNAGVLFFASSWRTEGLPAFQLLSEIANDPDELETSPTGSLLLDALSMLHEIDPGRRAPVFRSADRIRRFHEAIAREYQVLTDARDRERWRREQAQREALRRAREEAARVNPEPRPAAFERRGPLVFPNPPLPGTDSIVPLATEADLCEEGKQQENCVHSLANYAASCSHYFYRVLSPSRATLAIARGPDLHWRLLQIKGPRNAEVPAPTRLAVERWLDQAQRHRPEPRAQGEAEPH